MHSSACPSPDVLFRNVPDLTSTTKIIGTRAFAHGGYSDIWRAVEWSGEAPRNVAIKIIRVATRQKVSIDRIKMRISREVIAWCDLDHKNILPFYGLCWLPGDGPDGLPSMVYPYCEAGTCIDYLERHPDADRIGIIRQVADAVDYLHALQPPIAHGDIKANNILMKTDGTPMLADFGLSRVVMEVSTGLTTSSNRGSCRWMAPELFGGVETQVLVLVSRPSDVWAFGCLCLEILSGTHPWASARTDAAVMLAVVVERRRPTLPADIESTDIGHIIRHCWAHQAEHRPSMAQLVSALLRNDPEILHDPSCVFQPPSTLSDSPPSIRNNDLDSFTPMFSDSPLVTVDQRTMTQTKTPTTSMLEPLFPPLPPSRRPVSSSPSIGGANPSPSPSGATPYIDSLGLTPSDSSSSGPASRDEPSLFDQPLHPPLFGPGPRRPSKTIRETRQSSTPMWPRTPAPSSSTLPHIPRAGDEAFSPEFWQRSDPSTPLSAVTRTSSQASFHVSTPPRADSRHGLPHHTPVSMSPLSQSSSDRSTVSTSHLTPITPATPLPPRYHRHSHSSNYPPPSPSPQGNYFASHPQLHPLTPWFQSGQTGTIPRDFQLAQSKPIRISTPDGQPVTFTRESLSSPLRDRPHPP